MRLFNAESAPHPPFIAPSSSHTHTFAAQIKPIVKELAGSRRRMLLVQAISQARQRRPTELTISLLNLLSCTRAMPLSEPMAWTDRGELKDLYATFTARVRIVSGTSLANISMDRTRNDTLQAACLLPQQWQPIVDAPHLRSHKA
jgi:hypothetical protein